MPLEWRTERKEVKRMVCCVVCGEEIPDGPGELESTFDGEVLTCWHAHCNLLEKLSDRETARAAIHALRNCGEPPVTAGADS